MREEIFEILTEFDAVTHDMNLNQLVEEYNKATGYIIKLFADKVAFIQPANPLVGQWGRAGFEAGMSALRLDLLKELES